MVLRDSDLSLNFRAKPWRQVSDAPSQRYFNKRCPPPAAALGD